MLETLPVVISPADGPDLAAVLHRPATEPAAAIVVAHGMLSSKDSPKHRAICEAAARAGLLALRFDFRGRGASAGDPEDLTVSHEVTDLAAAVGWLRRHGPARTALVGSSLGGTVALLAAVADRHTAALVTVAAPARLPTAARASWAGAGGAPHGDRVEVAPGVFIRTSFFTDAARHDPLAAAAGVRCPWLIIHGADDPVVPAADAALLAAAQPGARLVLRPDAGHRFETPHREWLVARVVAFLAQHLAG